MEDAWQKVAWAREARRLDVEGVQVVARCVRWNRGAQTFAFERRGERWKYEPRMPAGWEHLWTETQESERRRWYWPAWDEVKRSTSEWTETGTVVRVPCWPVVLGASVGVCPECGRATG